MHIRIPAIIFNKTLKRSTNATGLVQKLVLSMINNKKLSTLGIKTFTITCLIGVLVSFTINNTILNSNTFNIFHESHATYIHDVQLQAISRTRLCT